LKRIGIAFFSTRRAIRGAWHPAPIAAILDRPKQSSAFSFVLSTLSVLKRHKGPKRHKCVSGTTSDTQARHRRMKQ
jgi:hypothetical protein